MGPAIVDGPHVGIWDLACKPSVSWSFGDREARYHMETSRVYKTAYLVVYCELPHWCAVVASCALRTISLRPDPLPNEP